MATSGNPYSRPPTRIRLSSHRWHCRHRGGGRRYKGDGGRLHRPCGMSGGTMTRTGSASGSRCWGATSCCFCCEGVPLLPFENDDPGGDPEDVPAPAPVVAVVSAPSSFTITSRTAPGVAAILQGTKLFKGVKNNTALIKHTHTRTSSSTHPFSFNNKQGAKTTYFWKSHPLRKGTTRGPTWI